MAATKGSRSPTLTAKPRARIASNTSPFSPEKASRAFPAAPAVEGQPLPFHDAVADGAGTLQAVQADALIPVPHVDGRGFARLGHEAFEQGLHDVAQVKAAAIQPADIKGAGPTRYSPSGPFCK